MAKTKSTTPKHKPVWQLSRRGVYGGIALVLTACAWTFFLGVLVGRGTAPVHFDIEKLGHDLQTLREQVEGHQAEQLQAYSAALENKSDLDFYEALKQSGENTDIDPGLTRTPLRPTVVPEPRQPAEAAETPASSDIPVKTPMPGLQPKKNAKPRPPLAKKPAAAAPAPAAATGALTLQVASLQDAGMADAMVARLRREGYHAVRASVTIPGKGDWHRVQVGRFGDRQAASATIRTLEARGLKPILVSR